MTCLQRGGGQLVLSKTLKRPPDPLTPLKAHEDYFCTYYITWSVVVTVNMSLLQKVGIGEYRGGQGVRRLLQKIDRRSAGQGPELHSQPPRTIHKECVPSSSSGRAAAKSSAALLPHLARRVVVVDRCTTLERLLGGRQRRACARPAALAVHCAGCVPRRGGHHPHSTLMVLQRGCEGRRREARGARCPGGWGTKRCVVVFS